MVRTTPTSASWLAHYTRDYECVSTDLRLIPSLSQ